MPVQRKSKLWIFGWTILYASFLFIDVFSPQLSHVSSLLKYISLLLCVCFACVYQRSRPLLLLAIIFTAFADVLLLFTDKFAWGVSIFCCAQACHALRFSSKKKCTSIVLFIYVVFLLLLTKLWLRLPTLYTAVCIYCLLFITAIIESIVCWKSQRTKRSFISMLGMLLFFLCDVNVALFNTGAFGSAPLFRFSSVGMWLFYLPSQILLVHGDDLFSQENQDH